MIVTLHNIICLWQKFKRNCFEDAREKREQNCAMQEEIDAIHKNDTWKLVLRSNYKWVCWSTLNFDGTLNKCKA